MFIQTCCIEFILTMNTRIKPFIMHNFLLPIRFLCTQQYQDVIKIQCGVSIYVVSLTHFYKKRKTFPGILAMSVKRLGFEHHHDHVL